MTSFMQDTRDPEEELGLLELLGEGSYGAVYRAESRANDNEVAVKIIPADNPADLLKEVEIMLACVSPYIVRLHDCYYKDNEAWLVMDYIGGGSVCDILEACDVTLTEQEARECTAWTVLALDYLHSNRKLHRDVKAGNILLTLDGRAKLADFGVSKEVNTMANKAQTAIGTPYWMAPEVIQEIPYDGQADIWSLAITCFEMVEGHPPLSNVHPMRAIFMIPSKPSPRLSEPARWSLEFNDFLARCLEKKPEDRPSARSLLQHPWIVSCVQEIRRKNGSQGSATIRNLVQRHLPVVTSFREDASEAKLNQSGDYGDELENQSGTMRRLSALNSGNVKGFPSEKSNGTGSVALVGPANDEDERHSTAESSPESDSSVIRVPLDGEDDGYSSGGSVVRVPINNQGGDGDEDSDSDSSVVRIPLEATGDCNEDNRCTVDISGVPLKAADGREKRKELQQQPSVRFNIEHEAMTAKTTNLQAAAKYFGGSKTSAASNGNGMEQMKNRSAEDDEETHLSPEVGALRQRLKELDLRFADELATLRRNYDQEKSQVQAALRAALVGDTIPNST